MIVRISYSVYLGRMKQGIKGFILSGWCFLLCIHTHIISAQNAAGNAVLEISEVVLPQGEKLKHQKNLYYEVHSSHTSLPTPAYWYKIVFIKDCSLKFSLFPLYEQDTYDVHCFKLSPEAEVCNAIKQNKLVSCNEQREYKNYNDDVVNSKADAGFVEFKELKLKAGDVLFIEIFSTRGKDCGHIFECQTNSAFFVIKQINRMCPTTATYNSDLTIPVKKYQTVESEKQAIEYLQKTLCQIKENELTVMSIKMNDVKPVFASGLDFVGYSKNINEIALKLPVAEAPKPALPTPPVVQKPKIDTPAVAAKKTEPVINKPKVPVPVPVPVPAPAVVKQDIKPPKSTADLEIPDAPSAANNDNTYSRLDIDKTLFTLLTKDLKEQIEYNNDLIKEYNAKLKKSKSKNEKESLATAVSELKQQNSALQAKTKDVRQKLKTIQQAIPKNKKGGSKSG